MPSEAARRAQRLAARMHTAQAKVDALRGELEPVVLAVRSEGASLADLAKLTGMSRPGILKMIRRSEPSEVEA